MDRFILERRATVIVEAVIKFFQWTPNWLLFFVGFPCWMSAVVLWFGNIQGLTTAQHFVYWMGAAMLSTVCGLAIMFKSE